MPSPSPTVWLVWAAVAVVLVVVIVRIALGASAPHTVVAFAQGKLTLERGALPGALIEDLRELAIANPEIDGQLEFRGSGHATQVRAKGISERYKQRIINVAAPHRAHVQRPKS